MKLFVAFIVLVVLIVVGLRIYDGGYMDGQADFANGVIKYEVVKDSGGFKHVVEIGKETYNRK